MCKPSAPSVNASLVGGWADGDMAIAIKKKLLGKPITPPDRTVDGLRDWSQQKASTDEFTASIYRDEGAIRGHYPPSAPA